MHNIIHSHMRLQAVEDLPIGIITGEADPPLRFLHFTMTSLLCVTAPPAANLQK